MFGVKVVVLKFPDSHSKAEGVSAIVTVASV